MAQEEKVFADGFVFKRNESAPEFVVGRLSMKADEAISFIKLHMKNGWVNLDIKQARSGNYYVELDKFEGKDTNKKVSSPKVEEDDNFPF
jgi:hypothetical protein